MWLEMGLIEGLQPDNCPPPPLSPPLWVEESRAHFLVS